MAGVIYWYFSCAKTFAASWLPFPKTVFLLFNNKARKSASYIETCHGAIRVGLKFSFIPFRYVGTCKNISIKPQGSLVSEFHFVVQVSYCILHLIMGINWYSTAGRGIGVDEKEKQNLVWQKILYFYYQYMGVSTIMIIWFMRKRADSLKLLITAPFHMEQRCIDEGATGTSKLRCWAWRHWYSQVASSCR